MGPDADVTNVSVSVNAITAKLMNLIGAPSSSCSETTANVIRTRCRRSIPSIRVRRAANRRTLIPPRALVPRTVRRHGERWPQTRCGPQLVLAGGRACGSCVLWVVMMLPLRSPHGESLLSCVRRISTMTRSYPATVHSLDLCRGSRRIRWFSRDVGRTSRLTGDARVIASVPETGDHLRTRKERSCRRAQHMHAGKAEADAEQDEALNCCNPDMCRTSRTKRIVHIRRKLMVHEFFFYESSVESTHDRSPPGAIFLGSCPERRGRHVYEWQLL